MKTHIQENVKENKSWLIWGLAFVSLAFIFATSQTAQAAETTKDTKATVDLDSGVLSLDAVPTLDFGSHTISADSATYAVTNLAGSSVTVRDARGTNAGWKLSATLGAFKNLEAASLPESSIEFDDTRVSSTSLAGFPTVENTVSTLSASTESSLFASAAEGKGGGTWSVKWNTGINLVVPAGAGTTGTHEGTITWSLIDAP